VKKIIEKLFRIDEKKVLKWGRFNAYTNLLFGFFSICSSIFVMTVLQKKADQVANTRRLEADSLNGLSLFDSGDEFYVISYHLNKDAGMIQQIPETLSVLIFIIGLGFVSMGISKFKLYKFVKEKEEQI